MGLTASARNLWRSALALLALGFAPACGEPTADDDRLPELDSPATADPSPVHAGTPLEASRAYYAAWGRCLHRTHARLDQSWSRYTVDIDTERDRLRTRGVQPYLDTLDSQLEGCPLGTERPADVPEALATQGRAFVLAARSYNSRAREMSAYFDAKAYEEDAWDDLKRLGPALGKAYDAADAAATAFASVLDVQRDQADRAWLVQLASESPPEDSAAWQVTQTTVAARSLSHCITAQRPLPPPCLKAATAFATARSDLETYRSGHLAEALGVFWFDVYRGHAEALDAATRTLQEPPARRRRGAPAPAPRERDVEQARAAVLAASDRVVFDFP